MAAGTSELIAGELAALQQAAEASPLLRIQSLYPELVRLSIEKTPYKSLTMSVRFTDAYPREPLAVEFTSSVLPEPLLSKLSAAVEKEAKAQAGAPQLLSAVQLAAKLVSTNMLLACWDEIRQVKEELAPAVLKLAEKSGKLSVSLCKEGHTLALDLLVADEYPAVKPTLKVLSSSLPTELTEMLTLQANELMRRMCEGSTSALALREERDLLAPPDNVRKRLEAARAGKKEIKVDLSTKGLSDLKSDRAFLSKAAQVRDTDQKEARQSRRMLVHGEKKSDEAKANADTKASAAKGHEPRKSVLAVLRFLALDWLYRMPLEECALCSKRIIPAVGEPEPRKGSILRVFCGHWFHASCVDPFMSSPPFDKACPTCEKPIYHPRWTSNKKLLEKRWAYEQAAKREVDDVVDFLGM